ncbi:ABC transporter [Haematobacter massiliensis]|uniref:ABC transporter n=2 Tax=Haematobacter massiliensis TaxID=195105 RepID=A0A086Y8N2_9RHOB|nr:ABC transporter [Haematobacter massiliensis]OWJ71521.1 ABC transporter [Haematobacter massiliensis]OWJ83451.1 ABC transporter [Haematobacter massiliensis]QBJ25098.1 ABC transporter substrate-binding protein [Haematobacter massiliensis]
MPLLAAEGPSRRSVLTMIGAGLLVATLPAGRALALTTGEARALIDRLVADINRIISSGMPEQAMYKEFERVFSQYADVPTIAASCLGPKARQTPAAQMRAYTQAFQGYIARKYGKRFRDFIGGQIEVTGSRQVNSFFEVTSVARLRGQQPFDVRWQVSDRSGANKFFNLIIEGVNMLATERTEVQAMLDQNGGDIARLTAALQRAG